MRYLMKKLFQAGIVFRPSTLCCARGDTADHSLSQLDGKNLLIFSHSRNENGSIWWPTSLRTIARPRFDSRPRYTVCEVHELEKKEMFVISL